MINELSFVAVTVALGAMKVAPRTPPMWKSSTLAEIREGLEAVNADRHILAILVLLISISLFGTSFAALIPVWAVQVLGGDSYGSTPSLP